MTKRIKSNLRTQLNNLPENNKLTIEILEDDSHPLRTIDTINVSCTKCKRVFTIRGSSIQNAIKLGTSGCSGCAKDKIKADRLLPPQEVLRRLDAAWGDKYQYPHFHEEYDGTGKKITVLCTIHNKTFTPTVHNLLQNHGCPQCAKDNHRVSSEEFVIKCNKIHDNKYDYSKVNLELAKSLQEKQIIICPDHGEFLQKASGHILGYGCAKCAKLKGAVSHKAIQWMETIEDKEGVKIRHILSEDGEFMIPGTQYFADGYCEENNTIYEFHGDYYHGNPAKYDPNKLHAFGRTYGERYDDTINREQEIRDLGFNLVTIWESDFDKLKLPRKTYRNVTTRGYKAQPMGDISHLHITLLDDEFVSRNHKHKWKCNICKKKFDKLLQKIDEGYKQRGKIGCSVKCTDIFNNGVHKDSRLDLGLWNNFLKEIGTANEEGFPIYLIEPYEYNGMHAHMKFECRRCKTSKMVQPYNILTSIKNKTNGCITCPRRMGWVKDF